MRKKNNFFLFILLCLALSCQSQSAKGYDINKVKNAQVGWLADSIYQLPFFSRWDRNRFYILGKKSIIGKTPKSAYELRRQAKAAIFTQLKIQFNQALRTLVREQINKDISDLIIDEAINQSIGNKVIKSRVVVEAYTINNDAYLLMQFYQPNLKILVENAVVIAKKLTEQPDELAPLPPKLSPEENSFSATNQITDQITNLIQTTNTNR